MILGVTTFAIAKLEEQFENISYFGNTNIIFVDCTL